MTEKRQQQNNKGDIELFKTAVVLMQKKSNRLKDVQTDFEEVKGNCVKIINGFFDDNGVHKTYTFDQITIDGVAKTKSTYRVNKVQKTKVTFDADKLEMSLGKKRSKKLISREYTINNMEGLVTYLKECGVDPQVFKGYIDVDKKVNIEELERLEALGTISKDNIEGCYTVDNAKPYFTINMFSKQGE